MIRTPLAALALACALSSHALADPACDAQFLGGQRPVLGQPQPDARELCSDAFVTLWSPATRDPVYSAEHLTPAGLTSADETARLDAFHAEDRLPPGARAELSDYAGGAHDRGHMAPAHDMPTPEAMRQSFALSNMIPQVPANNRGIWAKVEEFIREDLRNVYATRAGLKDVTDDVAGIKRDLSWLVKSVLGAIVLAVVGLVLAKSGGPHG